MKLERDFFILAAIVVCCTGLIFVGAHLNNTQEYGANSAVYPNPEMTPGALNTSITQSDIGQTICNRQWSTKSIRPSSAYTTALKKKQIVQYRYSDTDTASYEEDHLISLELGGNPTDPKNLWPEPYPSAKQKDTVENYLHGAVCAGGMTLAQAQKEIAADWYGVYLQISGPHAAGATAPDDSDPDDETN